MFSQYFGQYLLNKGFITKEQLADALNTQQSVHVKFGVIAVDEGYMTPLQIEQVHEMQKTVDKRFGEIGIELGYLTEEQVDEMLSTQKQDHLLLSQTLVDKGYMTIEQFGNALNNYKNEYSLSDEKFEEIKKGNIEVLVESLSGIRSTENKQSYIQYLTLFAKNIIRFIDDQVHMEVSDVNSSQFEEWFVKQEIIGESSLLTAISANEEVFLYIASSFAEESLTEVDELAKASLSEFLNLHNGIYTVNKSNVGIELTMKPPKVINSAELEFNPTGLLVKVNISTGSFYLLLIEETI